MSSQKPRMTRDPAVDAAQRVTQPRGIPWAVGPGRYALHGAREALAPIRELHRPGHPVYTQGHGADFEDLCPDCRGKAGVHECGCWGDYDRDIYCATCRDEKGRHAVWPCATALLVYTTDELEETQ
ncbi:hypothetical protein [Gordonia paraffinivorans]|uniref:hypothetical protein n=1 Tax=Gordonia paraffinivorans TaxID=175628 RepID=UPI003FCE2222